MSIFDLNLAVLTVVALGCWAFTMQPRQVSENDLKTCAAVVSFVFLVQWLSISGLRHFSVGTDTFAYYDRYLKTAVTPIQWIVNDIVMFYASYFSAVKDPGYALLEKGAQALGLNYQWFLFVVAASFIVPFTLMIFRHSKNIYISGIIYSTLFYEFYSVTGNRQTIAHGIILLFGLEAIFRRNLLRFVIIILAVSCIHKSALIFLPAYFLYNVRPSRLKFAIVISSLPVLFILRDQVISVLSSLSGYEQYTREEHGSPLTFSLALIGVVLAVLWRLPYIVNNDRRVWLYINSILVSVLMLPMLFTNPVAMRAIQYYSIFLVMLIPEVVSSFGSRERGLVVMGVSVVLIGLFILVGNEVPYAFFWEGSAR